MKKIYTTILGLALMLALNNAAKAAISITIDGTFTDWDGIAYTSTDGTGTLTGLKTYADADYIYIYMEGTTAWTLERFDFFLNSDNNAATGYIQGSYPGGSGADLLFQGNLTSGTVFNQSGGSGFSWTPSGATFASTINFSALTTVGSKKIIEFSIKKSEISLTTGTVTFSFNDSNSSYATLGALPGTASANPTYATVPLTGGTLPVSFLTFNGKVENAGVKLNWSTASEKDNAYFDVAKSIDGKSFSSIATVSGSINSDSQKFYSYVDQNVTPGTAYYQLSQYDLNGKSTLLKTISVSSDLSGLTLNVTKSYGADEISVSIYSPSNQTSTFTLTDVLGRRLVTKKLNLVSGNQQFKIMLNKGTGLNIATLFTTEKVLSQKYMF
ncbi:hypothetical protein I5M32_11840 [Pedobacter sp. SD-b]|uniref:Por secretion system C-terminal sorting domain-containing protein n=1 Tax=Pedobacter segetis TaxID=2793069 RepID=A0ABS1BL81_9SPHI|nr:hypothetical protein [Pedobacter segetis]MBK0383650.1 hypothetical protein [Pedobacter segetis]